MFRQAILQSERLQYGRKGCLPVELRSLWVLYLRFSLKARVRGSREIAAGSKDIHNGRAKVVAGVDNGGLWQPKGCHRLFKIRVAAGAKIITGSGNKEPLFRMERGSFTVCRFKELVSNLLP
jgi:hypothetical protein